MILEAVLSLGGSSWWTTDAAIPLDTWWFWSDYCLNLFELSSLYLVLEMHCLCVYIYHMYSPTHGAMPTEFLEMLS